MGLNPIGVTLENRKLLVSLIVCDFFIVFCTTFAPRNSLLVPIYFIEVPIIIIVHTAVDFFPRLCGLFSIGGGINSMGGGKIL